MSQSHQAKPDDEDDLRQRVEVVLQDRIVDVAKLTPADVQQMVHELQARQKALQESEELHRITLENISDPVFITDENGRYTYICPNSTNALGYTPAEIEAMGPISNLLGEVLFDPVVLKAQGKITNIEQNIVTKSGQVKTFLVEVKQVNIKGDKLLYTCRDITERKRHLDLLNKYKQIIAGTADSISLVDCNYVYQVVNPAYLKRTVKPRHEIEGHHISEIMGKDVFENLIKPEFDACLKGEKTHYQAWFTSKGEGDLFMDVTYSPYINEHGEIDGVLVSTRDLTEIRLAEERLHKETARFQTVWQSVSDAMVLSDEDGIVLEINPAYEALYGYNRDEVVGHNFAIIFPEEVREWANAEYQKTFMNPAGSPHFEAEVMRRDGTQRTVESRVTFLEEDGKRVAMLSAIRDITERKQMEALEKEQRKLAETLMNTITDMSQSLQVDDILNRVLKAVENVVPHDLVTVMLLNDKRTQVQFMRRCDCYPEKGLTMPPITTPLAFDTDPHLHQMLISGDPILIPDTATDPGWKHKKQDLKEIRSYIGVPIIIQGKVNGFINVGSLTPHHYADELVMRVKTLAYQAAIALHNAQLYERQRKLIRHVVAIQEEERRRIAYELHDDAGQAVTALKIGLDLMRDRLPDDEPQLQIQYDQIIKMASETAVRIRQLAHGLRPPALDTVGLDATLEGLCRDISLYSGLVIQYKGTQIANVPDVVSIGLYRVCQEALTNVVRHAQATHVSVALAKEDDTILLLIEDDGQGFDAKILTAANESSMGMGISGIRDRIELLDGTVTIQSKPGSGTRFVVSIPWRPLHD